jgi:hypothetical protein
MKHKFKVGTRVEFRFAGQGLIGDIKEITTDKGYSAQTWWYHILVAPQQGDNGTTYPVRVEDKTIKKVNK